jgi:transcriptional regulator with XRE-family HTH domain
MAQKVPQLLGLVLSILRQMAGWTQGRLEREAGLGQGGVSRLERGENLDRMRLEQLAAILGTPSGWVQGLITALEPYFAPAASIGAPTDLNHRQQQILDQLGLNVAATTRGVTARNFRKRLWQIDRTAATAAWQRLRKAPEGNRTALVEAVSDFHTWAVVERLCEESAKAASHDVDDAASLAALARLAAAHTPGAVGYRTWLVGYALAFEGYSRHVSGDLMQARQVFVEAEAQLQAGTPVEPMDRSRPLHLHGIHLNFRGDLDAALHKTDQAFAIARTAVQRTRILINRADVLKRKLQVREALHVLADARRHVKGTGETRLEWAIAFNEATYLWEAGDADEAASRLDAIRIAALKLGRRLDLVRLRWLAARVAFSQGSLEEASSLLNEVWKALADRRIWFDAALAALDLAGVELDRGKTREVKGLATAAAYVFTAQVLPTELLASIQLFWEAARQEAASAQEARDLAQLMRRSGGGDTGTA